MLCWKKKEGFIKTIWGAPFLVSVFENFWGLAQGIEHVFFLVLLIEGVLSYLGRIGYCY